MTRRENGDVQRKAALVFGFDHAGDNDDSTAALLEQGLLMSAMFLLEGLRGRGVEGRRVAS